MPQLRWHHTYPVRHQGDWHSSFQAKPREKLEDCHIHSGKLTHRYLDAIHTDVITFQSCSKFQAEKLSSGLSVVRTVIERHLPELVDRLAVVETWIQTVESVEYFPGQKKTVQKEDTVVIQRQLRGEKQAVSFDQSQHDVSQFRHDHPILADLMEKIEEQFRGQRIVCGLRAVLVQGVYHLTSVTFSCCGVETVSSFTSRHDLSCEDGDGVDGSERLVPTAPVLELEPTAPEQEEPVSSSPDPDEDDLPPSYGECVGVVRGLPSYESCSDPPPSYCEVEHS